MFRRFRHKLLLLLQVGILGSGAAALVLRPDAWQPVLICVLGASLTALFVGRVARKYLQATLGRLRRVADDLGHDRPVPTLAVQPGDDMYKLNAAVNLLATRLAEASREEKRLHEELRRRERLAFLGELAATVAHEVNNPLDGVQNCSRILRRSLDDAARSRKMLDLIDSGLGRIELIVRRLLTLAREHVIRPTEVHLAEVVDSAIAMVMPRIGDRDVRLERQVATPDDRVMADRPLLEQVFVNLLMNAADSMRAGGALTITVRRERDVRGAADSDGPADELCVDVADTGSGIAPEVLPHIFEPFFTTKTGGKGTGLGLAVASRIVDAHRGVLSVAPREDGQTGTVFTMRIPAVGAPRTTPAAVALHEDPERAV